MSHILFGRESAPVRGLLDGFKKGSAPVAGCSDVCLLQGDENRLCGLLEDLRKVRAVETSPKLRHPSLQLLDKAKELNRIR